MTSIRRRLEHAKQDIEYVEPHCRNFILHFLYHLYSKNMRFEKKKELKEKLENAMVELTIVEEALGNPGRIYPPCCLEFHEDYRISCDMFGPLPEEGLVAKCKECRSYINREKESIKKMASHLYSKFIDVNH